MLGDAGPGLAAKVQLLAQDAAEHLALVRTTEGRHATEQDVEDHAGGPHISWIAIIPLRDVSAFNICFQYTLEG